jgi:hypothetical protein
MTKDTEVEIEDDGSSYILIDKTTRLYMSPRNWQLCKVAISKGKEVYTPWRTYTKLDNAVADIIHMKVAAETFRSLDGLNKAYNKVVKEVASKLAPKYKVEEI